MIYELITVGGNTFAKINNKFIFFQPCRMFSVFITGPVRWSEILSLVHRTFQASAPFGLTSSHLKKQISNKWCGYEMGVCAVLHICVSSGLQVWKSWSSSKVSKCTKTDLGTMFTMQRDDEWKQKVYLGFFLKGSPSPSVSYYMTFWHFGHLDFWTMLFDVYLIMTFI